MGFSNGSKRSKALPNVPILQYAASYDKCLSSSYLSDLSTFLSDSTKHSYFPVITVITNYSEACMENLGDVAISWIFQR